MLLNGSMSRTLEVAEVCIPHSDSNGSLEGEANVRDKKNEGSLAGSPARSFIWRISRIFPSLSSSLGPLPPSPLVSSPLPSPAA